MDGPVSIAFSGIPLVWLGCVAAFLVFGVLLVVYGRRQALASRQLHATGTRTQARVVNNERHESMRDDNGHRTVSYSPLVQFYGPDGTVVSARTPRSLSYPLAIDSVVPIVFDPRQPTRVEITEGPGAGRSSTGLAGCLLIFGALMLLACAGLGVAALTGWFR